MFTNLLESRGKKPKSAGGSMVSLAAHAAIIVVGIHASLHAGQPTEPPPDKVVFAAEPVVKPVVPKPATRRADIMPVPDGGGLILKDVVNIPDQLPNVDVAARPMNDDDWLGKARRRGSGIGTFGTMPSGSGVYLASQVDEPVIAAPGSVGPRYPEMLRAAGVQGEVVVTFVVDTTGRVDPSSLVIVKETDRLFGAAVRSALPAMRFIPAKADGRKVRQQVQQPFVFTIIK
jgi:protein TonB